MTSGIIPIKCKYSNHILFDDVYKGIVGIGSGSLISDPTIKTHSHTYDVSGMSGIMSWNPGRDSSGPSSTQSWMQPFIKSVPNVVNPNTGNVDPDRSEAAIYPELITTEYLQGIYDAVIDNACPFNDDINWTYLEPLLSACGNEEKEADKIYDVRFTTSGVPHGYYNYTADLYGRYDLSGKPCYPEKINVFTRHLDVKITLDVLDPSVWGSPRIYKPWCYMAVPYYSNTMGQGAIGGLSSNFISSDPNERVQTIPYPTFTVRECPAQRWAGTWWTPKLSGYYRLVNNNLRREWDQNAYRHAELGELSGYDQSMLTAYVNYSYSTYQGTTACNDSGLSCTYREWYDWGETPDAILGDDGWCVRRDTFPVGKSTQNDHIYSFFNDNESLSNSHLGAVYDDLVFRRYAQYESDTKSWFYVHAIFKNGSLLTGTFQYRKYTDQPNYYYETVSGYLPIEDNSN